MLFHLHQVKSVSEALDAEYHPRAKAYRDIPAAGPPRGPGPARASKPHRTQLSVSAERPAGALGPLS